MNRETSAAVALAFSAPSTAAPIPTQPRPTDRVLMFYDAHSQMRDREETDDQVMTVDDRDTIR